MGSRTWEMTLNNYEEKDIELFKSWEDEVLRMKISKEVGESGTPHLQGRISFRRVYRMAGLKKLHSRVHWEKTLAAQDNLYVMKEDSEIIIDVNNSRQGCRMDGVVKDIKEGKSMRSVAEEHPEQYVRYHRGFHALAAILEQPRGPEDPEVIVYWGPTGTGKTWRARQGNEGAYEWGPEMEKWWDGYEGEKTVIMDEFRGQLPLGTMLRLLQGGRCRIQVKGGSREFQATKIILTSPKPPEEWYADDGYDKVAQLLRRINEIVYCDEKFEV